jgi:hypothetical protein
VAEQWRVVRRQGVRFEYSPALSEIDLGDDGTLGRGRNPEVKYLLVDVFVTR